MPSRVRARVQPDVSSEGERHPAAHEKGLHKELSMRCDHVLDGRRCEGEEARCKEDASTLLQTSRGRLLAITPDRRGEPFGTRRPTCTSCSARLGDVEGLTVLGRGRARS